MIEDVRFPLEHNLHTQFTISDSVYCPMSEAHDKPDGLGAAAVDAAVAPPTSDSAGARSRIIPSADAERQRNDHVLAKLGMLSDAQIHAAIETCTRDMEDAASFIFLGAWPPAKESVDLICDRIHETWVREMNDDVTSDDDDADEADGVSRKRFSIPDWLRQSTPVSQKVRSREHRHQETKGFHPLRMAFVLNTSVTGSHWVAVFIENHSDHIAVEYFDSFGQCPTGHMMLLMQDIVDRLVIVSLNEKPIRMFYFSTKLQNKHIQCGGFVIWYILHRVAGTSLSELTKNTRKIDDEAIARFVTKLRVRGVIPDESNG